MYLAASSVDLTDPPVPESHKLRGSPQANPIRLVNSRRQSLMRCLRAPAGLNLLSNGAFYGKFTICLNSRWYISRTLNSSPFGRATASGDDDAEVRAALCPIGRQRGAVAASLRRDHLHDGSIHSAPFSTRNDCPPASLFIDSRLASRLCDTRVERCPERRRR